MSYSLGDKILRIVREKGVPGAYIADGTLVLPSNDENIKFAVTGVVTRPKLDAIVNEWKAKQQSNI